MATQSDRLAKIASEGFAMRDEVYGRGRRPPRYPFAHGQGPQPQPQRQPQQWNPDPKMREKIMSSEEVAEKFGGFIRCT